MNIYNGLEKLGLSEKQSMIYLLLIQQGELRISDIVRVLRIPRSSVYESLKGLFELGLAEEIIKNSYKAVKAYPVGVMRHSLEEKLTALQNQTNDLEKLEKALNKLPGTQTPPTTKIRYYQGRAGARQIFWNTFKAHNTLYVYSEWGRGRYLGIKFYRNFVSESYARNVQEKVLTNNNERVLESIRQHAGTPMSRTNIDSIRMLDESTIRFKGDTLMYDNIYAQVYLKDEEINGFEIESNAFAATQRAIFETLWETAGPLARLL